uniref:ResB-like family cytochrome C biogenesis protein n=1 Tax=Geobacter metallireducens TaxID=28232 RepID=A0A831UDQ2_GEOME
MLKRFFLSRTTVITLIALMLGAVLLGYFFPQRFLTPPEELAAWQLAHPGLATLWRALALDHVYTSPWFALLLLLFLMSLVFSTRQQFQLALNKMRTGGQGGACFETSSSLDEAAAAARDLGYRQVGDVAGGGLRFVRYPWGYWGNFLLHLGMVVSIASFLVILLYEKRAVVHLVEGEVHGPGNQWLQEERGLLAGSLRLPGSVRLDRVKAEYYPNDNLKQLVTDFSLIGPQGEVSSLSMQINRSRNHQGIRIFQGRSFGRAFFVTFARGPEEHREIFMLDHPRERSGASYKDFTLDWLPYKVKAKYYADAERKSIDSLTPLFALRLVDGTKVMGEVSLKPGETGRLGDYVVQLVAVERWGGIIFIDTPGMGGIFAGFFILCLGGALSYFWPPREFTAESGNGVCRISWRASRFERLYREEFDAIRQRLAARSPIPEADRVAATQRKER